MTYLFSRKSRHFLPKVLLLFLICAGLFSCEKKEYSKMIPADAALVVRSNLKAMAEEAGGMEQLKKRASSSNNPLLTALSQDAEECGIAFEEDAYLYASLNRDEPTLLFALADQSKFEAKLKELNTQGLCGEIQQGNPFRWVAFPGKGLCAYTDDFAAWVYAPITPPESILSRLQELQNLEEKDMFITQAGYLHLESMKGSTRFYLSLETLPNTDLIATTLGMPFQLSAEDLRLYGSISLVPKQASLKAKLYSDNTEVQEFLVRQSLDMHAFSGKYFSYLPDDLLACIALKLDGNGYSKINAIPDIGSSLSTLAELSGIDAEPFLDSFSGDFLFAIHSADMQNPMPGISCYAECAGKGTKEMLKEAMQKSGGLLGPMLQTVSPDNYVMRLAPEFPIHLGVKDHDFYFTTTAGKPFESPEHPLRKAGYSALSHGKLIAYALFCPGKLQAGNDFIGEYMGENAGLFSGIRAIEFAARPGQEIELNVYFPE